MFALQPAHLALIFIAFLILIVPRQLPGLGRGLGKSITEFKKAVRESADSQKAIASSPEQEPLRHPKEGGRDASIRP